MCLNETYSGFMLGRYLFYISPIRNGQTQERFISIYLLHCFGNAIRKIQVSQDGLKL